MTSLKFAAIGFVAAMGTVLTALTAQAQALRTFVSTSGLDTNPCTITAPCRHFQAAVTATAVGGEVDALDAGSYSPISISKAITIEGQGWSYIAPPAAGSGIKITASTGNVIIRGVSINGVGVTGTTNGISFSGGGTLDIQKSVIQNVTNDGIHFEPSATSQLFVSDTLLDDNGSGSTGSGIHVTGAAYSTITGEIDRVRSQNNAANGLASDAFSTVNISISNSVFANNSNCGLSLAAGDAAVGILNAIDSTIANNYNGACTAAYAQIAIRNSMISGSTNDGAYSIGQNGLIYIGHSIISGNYNGVIAVNPGHVFSWGDNMFDGNSNSDGSFTGTVAYK